MSIDFAFFAPVFGILFGSFATVLYSRTLTDESFVAPASYCDMCKRPLKKRYLVPVFGYLLQRGNSACCNKKISSTNLVIELGTALLFTIAFFRSENLWQFTALGFLATVSIPLVLLDIELHRLPNRLTYPTFILVSIALIFHGIHENSFEILISTLIRLGVIFVVFAIIFIVSKGGIGIGDLKLSLLIGAVFSFETTQSLIAAFIYAFLMGAISGLYLMLIKKASAKMQIPFGPYLILGAWMTVTLGATIASRVTSLWTIQ